MRHATEIKHHRLLYELVVSTWMAKVGTWNVTLELEENASDPKLRWPR